MEIKINCNCGARYTFEVEPRDGCMPMPVQCPTCGADGTGAANQVIRQNLMAAATPNIAAPGKPGLRVASAQAAPAPVPPGAGPSGSTGSGALLDRTTYLVKERVGLLKLVDTYDILDPQSGQPIGIAREEPPTWAKFLRLLVNKQLLPTSVRIYEAEGQPPVLSVHRGFTLLRSKVRVVAGDGQCLGYFQSKLLSIGGAFCVFNNQNQQIAEVKGNWKGWDFKFLNASGREIGAVTKKWAGLGKELFTSADNYVISLTDPNPNPAASALLLAAGLAIDIVLKESSG